MYYQEEYAQDSLEKNAKKFLGKDLRGKVNESLDKYHGGLDAVYKKQNDLVELTRQVETLSPRAITQGWFQELSRNVYDLRNDLTKEKINCLMNLGLRVGETEQVLNYKVQEIERMAAVRNRITYSRDKVRPI